MSGINEIDTPAVLIDIDRVKENLSRFQGHCNQHKIKLRPHIKTHKLPRFAALQVELGAVGITCQKIGEAEIMAKSGINDILISYNILGEAKLRRLVQLAKKCNLSVVADNQAVVEGLSKSFSHESRPLDVLVECDTGAGRCGTQSVDETVKLALAINSSPGLTFAGLMTYPPMGQQPAVERWLSAAIDGLAAEGLSCSTVSCGGTPNMWDAQLVKSATEHRAGTYIYNDNSLIAQGICTAENCALTVLVTVVSRPTQNRAVIDAGSKVLTSDQLGLEGFGLIPSAPEAKITGLSEEHGIIDLSSCDWSPQVGDRVEIIPNHACVVSNMVDRVNLVSNGLLVGEEPVAARGCVT
jgi:D-serine deaminase-like pyridoxal phosphate-dependent protein